MPPESHFLYGIISLVAGFCLGSFLNVVILRIPIQLKSTWERDSRDFLGLEPVSQVTAFNVAKPASHCPKCKTPLKAWHNIPVISYVLLRGKCAYCSAAVSLQYPIVELCSGLLFLFAYISYGLTIVGGLFLLFSLFLLTLTTIDFNTQLLPDILTFPLLWVGLIANSQGLFTDINSAVFGAVAGYLSLWSIYWVFKLFTGKEGMGHGDFKLLAALGAWTGWQMLPLTILLSSLVGAIIGITLTLTLGRDRQLPLAFGPYLAIAGWIAFLWGDQLVTTYLGYLS